MITWLKDNWHWIKVKIGSFMKFMTIGTNLVGRFLVPINFTLILLTFLKVNSVSLNKVFMITLIISVLIGVLCLGWFYDRIGLLKSEIEFDNQRNIMLNDIL